MTMELKPNRDLLLMYINENQYDDIVNEMPVDMNALKVTQRITKASAHDIYVLWAYARFEFAVNGLLTFNTHILKGGTKLQKELKRFGSVMTLTLRDIGKISFTIKGRKIESSHPSLKMALAKALKKIQNQDIPPVVKKPGAPLNPETLLITAMVPLAKYLKREQNLINADIYRHIQNLLSFDGQDAGLDFIRQRLSKHLRK